jgi:hypothetical protein
MAPGSVHVGFVVDIVALRQGFLRVLRFSPFNIAFLQGLHTHISSGGKTTGLCWPQFRDMVSPHQIKKKDMICFP